MPSQIYCRLSHATPGHSSPMVVDSTMAFIMIGGLWRSTRGAYCRPSFIPSLSRHQSFSPGGQQQYSGLGGGPHSPQARFPAAADASLWGSGSRSPSSASCRTQTSLHSHSLGNGRKELNTFRHLTSFNASHPDIASSSYTTNSSGDDEELLEPFTWSHLMDLFRVRSPQQHDTRNNNNDRGEDHYIPSDHPNLALFRRSSAAQASYERHKQYLDRYWRSAYDYLVVSKFGENFGFERATARRRKDDDCRTTDRSREENVVRDDTNDKNDPVIPPEGHVYRANPSLARASEYAIENGLSYLKLVLNDFSYDVDEGIEHWCLWKIGGSSCTEGILREELAWALRELDNGLLCADGDDNAGCGCIIERGIDPRTKSVTEALESSQIFRIGRRCQRRTDPIVDTFYWVNPPHLQSMPEIYHAHILVSRSSEGRNNNNG